MNKLNKKESMRFAEWLPDYRLIGVHQNDLDYSRFKHFNKLLMGQKKDICSLSAQIANNAIINMMSK